MTPAGRERIVRAALEKWLRRNRRARALTKAVIAAQVALRPAVGDETWLIFLALEERANARHNAIVSAAIRLAAKGADG